MVHSKSTTEYLFENETPFEQIQKNRIKKFAKAMVDDVTYQRPTRGEDFYKNIPHFFIDSNIIHRYDKLRFASYFSYNELNRLLTAVYDMPPSRTTAWMIRKAAHIEQLERIVV